MRTTCGPKIGLNKEVEFISVFNVIQTHIIFESLDYRVIIDYDLNPIAYHQVIYLILFLILMSCLK